MIVILMQDDNTEFCCLGSFFFEVPCHQYELPTFKAPAENGAVGMDLGDAATVCVLGQGQVSP